jgi:hypothetical protein
MHMKGLGLGGLFAVVALVGCGSSGGAGGTGGSTGTGGSGHAGSTGTAGDNNAGHSGGGGTTGAGGAFTTSVPGGTKLTALTSAQQTQLCNDVENFVDHTFLPELCNAAAAASVNGLEAAYVDLIENPSTTDAQLRADCSAADADAGANAGRCTDSLQDAGTQTCDISSTPATCQATVADYTKCLNDTTTSSLQYYASLPNCSTVTAASVNAFFAADGGLSAGPPEPASCAMFDPTCDVDGGTAAMTNMSPLPKLTRKKP